MSNLSFLHKRQKNISFPKPHRKVEEFSGVQMPSPSQRYSVFLSLLLLVSLISGCTKGDGNGSEGTKMDRKPLLENYANNYILPAYAAMAERMGTLQKSANEFTANPSAAGLSSLHAEWKESYKLWQQVDLLQFGYADEIALRTFVNTYPVSSEKVEVNIASGNYNLDAFESNDVQGFPAVGYLMGSVETNAAAAIVPFTAGQPNAAERKKYLLDVVDKMTEKVKLTNAYWQTKSASFINSTGTDAGSSFSKLINGFVHYYERYLRSGKIGIPAGAMSGTSLPGHVEAPNTPGFSNELAGIALQSIIAFYDGKSFQGIAQGEGLRKYFTATGTKTPQGIPTGDHLYNLLTTAKDNLASLNTPLEQAVLTERPKVLSIYNDLQQAVALLKVDLVSATGISITYTDNDGD